MVWFHDSAVEEVFAAISEPTRRRMLDLLAHAPAPDRELAVKEINRSFRMTQPAITQHLRVLERAGLVSQRKQGRFRLYRFEPIRLKEVYDWVAHYQRFWEERFARLGAFLDAQPLTPPNSPETSAAPPDAGELSS